jgi:hypothetical protein
MARQRDYAKEYARRVERGASRGISRSQARGHPARGEAHIAARASPPKYDARLEEGLKSIRNGTPLSKAARQIHVAPERLRGYLDQTGVAEKRGNRWSVGTDNRPRDVTFYSNGRIVEITVAGYEPAKRVGEYTAAVGRFLAGNDPAILDPFIGESVRDVKGRRYGFETRPNELYRLAEGGSLPFEQVYRIIAV